MKYSDEAAIIKMVDYQKSSKFIKLLWLWQPDIYEIYNEIYM